MGADEKFNTVLEQYSLEINRMYKFGGALYLETDEGLYILRQRNVREGRAVFEEKIKEHISCNGFSDIDIAVKNDEEKYVTEGTYGETYTLRKWFSGDECELTDKTSAQRAAETLGRMHRAMCGAYAEESPYVAKSVAETFAGRTGEMRRIVTYLRKQKQKSAFESWMEKQLPFYIEEAYRADMFLKKEYDSSLLSDAVSDGAIFHGSYTGHNVLMGDNVAVVNFDKAKIGPKVHDLYHLMRKCGEKTCWDIMAVKGILRSYLKENLLDDREINVLYSRLLYPEKFWKVVNMYYNGKKTWVPGKVEEKLTAVCNMQVQKEAFLKSII